MEDVATSTIEPIIMSDHAPITLSFLIATQSLQNRGWRLNECILQEEVSKTQLPTELSTFFELNDTQDVRPLSIWEAHKCHIRGSLIKLGCRRKKEHIEKLNSLITRIRRIETQHKKSQVKQSMVELAILLEQVNSLMISRVKMKMLYSRHLYYEFGKKVGGLLACSIQAPIHTNAYSGYCAYRESKSY